MIAIYLFILLLSLWGLRINISGYNSDYIGKDHCNAIKGVFIMVVFVRHIIPYISSAGYGFSALGDATFLRIDKMIGQLLVAMFLFYSGYGVMESILHKGKAYIDSMPKKRLLTTLLNFDVAVACFLLVNWLLGFRLDPMNVALAFTGWTAIGNSNWYIFVIMLCYLAVYLGFKYTKNEKVSMLSSLSLITFAYIILSNTKELYWHNTIFAFAAGLVYSWKKPAIESFVQSRYLLSLVLATACFLLFFYVPFLLPSLKNNLCAIFFALVIVILSMKIRVGNRALLWLGLNLFPLYIYQRIPMLVLCHVQGGAIIDYSPLLFVLLCAVVTVLFGWAYRYWQIKL